MKLDRTLFLHLLLLFIVASNAHTTFAAATSDSEIGNVTCEYNPVPSGVFVLENTSIEFHADNAKWLSVTINGVENEDLAPNPYRYTITQDAVIRITPVDDNSNYYPEKELLISFKVFDPEQSTSTITYDFTQSKYGAALDEDGIWTVLNHDEITGLELKYYAFNAVQPQHEYGYGWHVNKKTELILLMHHKDLDISALSNITIETNFDNYSIEDKDFPGYIGKKLVADDGFIIRNISVDITHNDVVPPVIMPDNDNSGMLTISHQNKDHKIFYAIIPANSTQQSPRKENAAEEEPAFSEYSTPISLDKGESAIIYATSPLGFKSQKYTVYNNNNGFTTDGSNVKILNEKSDRDAIYYNLQGARISNPQNGIFIKVIGNSSTKEYIR